MCITSSVSGRYDTVDVPKVPSSLTLANSVVVGDVAFENLTTAHTLSNTPYTVDDVGVDNFSVKDLVSDISLSCSFRRFNSLRSDCAILNSSDIARKVFKKGGLRTSV